MYNHFEARRIIVTYYTYQQLNDPSAEHLHAAHRCVGLLASFSITILLCFVLPPSDNAHPATQVVF